MRLIEVIVTPQGETHLRTEGYVGPACRDASRFLEQALGVATDERLTPAFYQDAESTRQVEHQS